MIFFNENIYINIEVKIIVHNSITLINGGDFDKCGGDIDGGDFSVGRFDLHSFISITKKSVNYHSDLSCYVLTLLAVYVDLSHNLYYLLKVLEQFINIWVSEWLLFNANSAIFQLFHGEIKLIFNEMMMKSALH